MLAMPRWFAFLVAFVLMGNTVGGAAWLSYIEGRVTRNTVDIEQGVATVNRIEAKLDQLVSNLEHHEGP